MPLLSRCVLATDTGGQFVVRVDSIGLPATASGNTAFDVRLYGAVGPNLCFRVQSVRAQEDSTHLDITVFGAKRDSGGDCLQMPASLDGRPVTVAPPIRDPFTVRVHQPDGSVLSQSLRVQE
ncbi:MAG: hypothetical protein ABI910_07850 [Gemmatimonadota bacterium]